MGHREFVLACKLVIQHRFRSAHSSARPTGASVARPPSALELANEPAKMADGKAGTASPFHKNWLGCKPHNGLVAAVAVVNMLRQSNLPSQVLTDIWSTAKFPSTKVRVSDLPWTCTLRSSGLASRARPKGHVRLPLTVLWCVCCCGPRSFASLKLNDRKQA